jgi:hypothetical protein
MSNDMMATILWIAAAVVLVLYLMRRSRRKRAR